MCKLQPGLTGCLRVYLSPTQERQQALELWMEAIFSSKVVVPRGPQGHNARTATSNAQGHIAGASRADVRFYEFLTETEGS